ncbi:MAG: hypothetical protein JXA01_01175 [Dehalococcoidia bacterium]|nr:hypothetical protein [Dehalococcoidia bacterium]
MNIWLKVGLPVLIGILLVISAVSITIAATASNTANQAFAGNSQVNWQAAGRANCGDCENCPAYGEEGCDKAKCTGGNQACISSGSGCNYGGAVPQSSNYSGSFRSTCCGSR